MSIYTSELAMAHVVMRAGGLRSSEDVAQVRRTIEYELASLRAIIERCDAQLQAIDILCASEGCNQDRSQS